MKREAILLFALCAGAAAQDAATMQSILERLDRLERENRALRDEVERLKAAREPAPAAEQKLGERVEVAEARTAELAQTKVEAGSRFPITITGMALFNAFLNSKGGGDSQYPTTASAVAGPATGGGSFRQSVIGLRFQGPQTVAGGKVSGSFYMDLWGGSSSSLNNLMRIRTATLEIDWKDWTLMAGQEKPLISPREPNSLAQVGVSPLTGAGNPWLWMPQARVERRFRFSPSSGLRAQAALFQTSETRATVPDEYVATIDPSRPGYQGRFELWKDFGNGARVEVAPGFHFSTSRANGYTVPSRIYSIDWMLRPHEKFDFSGLFFSGQNIAILGALRQGYVFFGGDPLPVHTRGGYAQAAWRPLQRLSFNMFSGQQDDRDRDLVGGRIGKNLVFGGNTMLRLAPNVILSFEGANIRTRYVGGGLRMVTHYDLALAYLF